MRTSPVSRNTTATYRSMRRLNGSDGAMFQANMQGGMHQHLDQQKKKKRKKEPNKPIKLSTHKGILIVKGIRFIGEEGAIVHNDLLYNAKKIHYTTKINIRNHIYKTSI